MGVIHEIFWLLQLICDLYGPETICEHSPAERESEVYENFIKFPLVLTAAGI